MGSISYFYVLHNLVNPRYPSMSISYELVHIKMKYLLAQASIFCQPILLSFTWRAYFLTRLFNRDSIRLVSMSQRQKQAFDTNCLIYFLKNHGEKRGHDLYDNCFIFRLEYFFKTTSKFFSTPIFTFFRGLMLLGSLSGSAIYICN